VTVLMQLDAEIGKEGLTRRGHYPAVLTKQFDDPLFGLEVFPDIGDPIWIEPIPNTERHHCHSPAYIGANAALKIGRHARYVCLDQFG
jgi:hypothetical protein